MKDKTNILTNQQAALSLDVARLRQDFPILKQSIHGHPLVYLDNAATTQKPQRVIDAISQFYAKDYSNVHRGVHTLSERATDAYEAARVKAQRFLNAKESCEIIFTRGTTEAINLVAQSYGRSRFQTGDEIIISEMEHHSNIVPWQILCEQTGAILRVIPINDAGEIIFDEYLRLLNTRTKLVAIVHLSNALGTINPLPQIIHAAHQQNIPVLIDGAQAVAHLKVDVQALDCDFYAFSGHKLFGPTGIGILYGKASLLDSIPPYQGGGDMISMVSFSKTLYNSLPYKFEAGTPNIAGAVGLGAALDYIALIDLDKIAAYEQQLLSYADSAIRSVPKLRLIGTAKDKASILSFVLDNIHAHDIGTILNHQGIAIRSGHHCAMPLMDRFQVAATARASLAFYNTHEEIDRLVSGLYKVQEMFG